MYYSWLKSVLRDFSHRRAGGCRYTLQTLRVSERIVSLFGWLV